MGHISRVPIFRTSQRVSVEQVEPSKVVSAVKTIRKKLSQQHNKTSEVEVGDFSFEDNPLKLGDLKGNKFSVVLRNVSQSEQDIDNSFLGLKEEGFINYYGMQRFGTRDVRTPDVGLALIKGEWLQAIELILRPRANERLSFAKAREFWWQYRRPEIALKILGFKNEHTIEGKLLLGLKVSHGNDLVSALNMININQRLMYIHSYQSLIWNKVVSKRIAKHGTKVLVGDLYLEDDAQASVEQEEEECQIEGESSSTGKKKADPKLVTEENLAKVSIFDVVMPLPGHSISYPENETKSFYETELRTDGLDFGSFRNTVKAYSLGGDYRRIVGRTDGLKWSHLRYSDPEQNLCLSDLERLDGKPDILSDPEGPYRALVVEFGLRPSNYATMALREAMKTDTSKQRQSELTSEHFEEHRKRKALIEEKESSADVTETKKAKVETAS